MSHSPTDTLQKMKDYIALYQPQRRMTMSHSPEDTLQKMKDYIAYLENAAKEMTTVEELNWCFNALVNAHKNHITLLHCYGYLKLIPVDD